MQGELPNFVIIGAMKSATTSLAHYLAAHPDVFMAPGKEVHYFDRNFDEGLESYRKQFAGATVELTRGEATPDYMYWHEVPPRMAEVIPEARLIAILRNPVDRAYSHFWHERARGRETLEFAEAIAAEPERLATGDRQERTCHSYLDRGRYLRQLLRVCEHYPRENLLVILTEDLHEARTATFQRVCRFLNVDDSLVPSNIERELNAFVSFRSLTVRNVIWKLYSGPRMSRLFARALGRFNTRRISYPPMPPSIRAKLRKHFEQDNAALAAWLQRDLSIWNN